MLRTCVGEIWSGGTPPMAWKLTVSSALFQPAALGGGAMFPLIANGAACTLNVTVAGALLLPALSMAEPLNDWFAPGVVIEIADGQLSIPESTSEHVKLTIAGLLAGIVTIPFTGAGVTVTVIVGEVLSTFRWVIALFVCPAASVTVPVICWSKPSLLIGCGV